MRVNQNTWKNTLSSIRKTFLLNISLPVNKWQLSKHWKDTLSHPPKIRTGSRHKCLCTHTNAHRKTAGHKHTHGQANAHAGRQENTCMARTHTYAHTDADTCTCTKKTPEDRNCKGFILVKAGIYHSRCKAGFVKYPCLFVWISQIDLPWIWMAEV